MTWITWNLKSEDIAWPPKFREKVNIFYQRTVGWQLHIADLLANGGEPLGKTNHVRAVRHSGFAVLHICLSYFETIGKIEKGDICPPKGHKGYFFKQGVRSVLPQLPAEYSEKDFEELLTKLYFGARCGLYHNSMTVPKVGLGQPDGESAIAYNLTTKELAISPERLPKALKAHLEEFRARLLDPKETKLRKNFERRFDADNGIAKR